LSRSIDFYCFAIRLKVRNGGLENRLMFLIFALQQKPQLVLWGERGLAMLRNEKKRNLTFILSSESTHKSML